jgi:hypothetical protein
MTIHQNGTTDPMLAEYDNTPKWYNGSDAGVAEFLLKCEATHFQDFRGGRKTSYGWDYQGKIHVSLCVRFPEIVPFELVAFDEGSLSVLIARSCCLDNDDRVRLSSFCRTHVKWCCFGMKMSRAPLMKADKPDSSSSLLTPCSVPPSKPHCSRICAQVQPRKPRHRVQHQETLQRKSSPRTHAARATSSHRITCS